MRKIIIITILASMAFGCAQKKVVEATYANGNPKIVRYYHKKAGNLVLDRELVYYENKQVKMKGEYKNELRDGQWKAWYKNGIIWSEGEYKGGKRNGIGIAYHENGKKYIEGMYRNDVRVGTWLFYDTTGVMTKEVNFDLATDPEEKESME